MENKAKALAKNRKPAQEDVDYEDMINQDRYEDPNKKKEVTPNTDDEGNPIATKDSIQVAPQKTKQMQADFEAYQQGQAKRRAQALRDKQKGK